MSDNAAEPVAPKGKTSPVGDFVSSLSELDIFYWRNKTFSYLGIAPLLLGSGILILICRSIFFGFDNAGVALLVELLSLMFVCLACAFAIIRPKAKLPEEVYRLAHLFAATWLLALSLFVPSFFPPLRWFLFLDSTWPIAAIYGLAAVLLLLVKSHLRSARKPSIAYYILVPSLVWGVTTIFLEVAIMDGDTNDYLIRNSQALEKLFHLGSPAN